MKRKKTLTSGDQRITRFFKTAEIQSVRVTSTAKSPFAVSSSSGNLCSTPTTSQDKSGKRPAITGSGTPECLPTPGNLSVRLREGRHSTSTPSQSSPHTPTVDLTLDCSDSDPEVVTEKVVPNPSDRTVQPPGTSKGVKASKVKKRLLPIQGGVCERDNPGDSEETEVICHSNKRLKLDTESEEAVNTNESLDFVDLSHQFDHVSEGSQESSGSQSWVRNIKISDVKSVTDVVGGTLIPIDVDSSEPKSEIESSEEGLTKHVVVRDDAIENERKNVKGDKAVLKSKEIDNNNLSDVKDREIGVGENVPPTFSCDRSNENSEVSKANSEEMTYQGYNNWWGNQSDYNQYQRGGFSSRGGHRQGGFPEGPRWGGFDRQWHGGFDGRQHQNNNNYWSNNRSGNFQLNFHASDYYTPSASHQREYHQSKPYDHHQGYRRRNKSENYWCRDKNVVESGNDDCRGRGKGKRRFPSDGHYRDSWRGEHGDGHCQHSNTGHGPSADGEHDHHGDDSRQRSTQKDDCESSQEEKETKLKTEHVEEQKLQSTGMSESVIDDKKDGEAEPVTSESVPVTTTPRKESPLPKLKIDAAPESPVSKGINNLKKLFAGSPKSSLLPCTDERSQPGSPTVVEKKSLGSPVSHSVGDGMLVDESAGSANTSLGAKSEISAAVKEETTEESETTGTDKTDNTTSPKCHVKVEDSPPAGSVSRSRSLPYREETSFEKLLASCGVDKGFASGAPMGTITKAVESLKVEEEPEMKEEEEEEDLHLLDSSDESDDDLMRPSAIALKVKSIEDACKPLPPVPEQDDIKIEPTSAPSRKTTTDSTSNFTWSLEKLLEEKREKESVRGRELSAMDAELKKTLKNDGVMEFDESQDLEDSETNYTDIQQKCLARMQNLESIQACHPGEEVFHPNKCHQIFTFPGNMTLSSCGYTAGKTKIDKHLLRFDKIGKLLEFAKSDFIDMCFKNISSQDAFLTWVFNAMSVVDKIHTVEDLFKILYIVWTKKDSVNWVPTIRDIAKVFVNYGADLETLLPGPLTVDFTESDLLSSEGKENEGKCEKIPVDNNCSYGRSNMLHVIQAITLAVQKRPDSYTSDDLCVLAVMMGKVALDKSLTQGALKFDLGLCFSAILNTFSNEEWNKRVDELCGHLSKLTSHHHNKVHLVGLILNCDPRGTFFQRRLAYTMLCKIFDTKEQERISAMKVQMLHQFTVALCTNPLSDYYLLSSVVRLLDQCVGKETLPSSEKPALQTLHQHARHLMGTIRDTILNFDCTKVKNMLVLVDAKWNFMLQGMGTKQATLFHWTNMASTVSTNQVESQVEDVLCSQSDEEDTKPVEEKNSLESQ